MHPAAGLLKPWISRDHPAALAVVFVCAHCNCAAYSLKVTLPLKEGAKEGDNLVAAKTANTKKERRTGQQRLELTLASVSGSLRSTHVSVSTIHLESPG